MLDALVNGLLAYGQPLILGFLLMGIVIGIIIGIIPAVGGATAIALSRESPVARH